MLVLLRSFTVAALLQPVFVILLEVYEKVCFTGTITSAVLRCSGYKTSCHVCRLRGSSVGINVHGSWVTLVSSAFKRQSPCAPGTLPWSASLITLLNFTSPQPNPVLHHMSLMHKYKSVSDDSNIQRIVRWLEARLSSYKHTQQVLLVEERSVLTGCHDMAWQSNGITGWSSPAVLEMEISLCKESNALQSEWL